MNAGPNITRNCRPDNDRLSMIEKYIGRDKDRNQDNLFVFGLFFQKRGGMVDAS